MIYQNVPVANHMRAIAFEGLSRDAKECDFTEALELIDVPVCIFYGSSVQSRIPSGLSKETREIYANRIKRLKFVEFNHSGHMIPDEEREKYLSEIDAFIDDLI